MHAITTPWVTPYALDMLERRRAELAHAAIPGWGHKTEVRVGDTVYLRHKQSIRSFTLTTAGQASPMDGKIAVNSPIGRSVLGRHSGQTVRIVTLDGLLPYEIMKII
jgi:transcription elongation GreA/GreB family factor